jgi:hypothetical protein
MKLNYKDWNSISLVKAFLLAVTFFAGAISDESLKKSKQSASFVNFFKFEILGVMDGIKGNTDANLWLFGKKIF